MEKQPVDANPATADEVVSQEIVDRLFAATILCVGFNGAYPGIFYGVTGDDDSGTISLVANTAKYGDTIKEIEAGLKEKCVRLLQPAVNTDDETAKVLMLGEALTEDEGACARWLNRQVLIEGIERGLTRLEILKLARAQGPDTAELGMAFGFASEIYRFSQQRGGLLQIQYSEEGVDDLARAFEAMFSGQLNIVAATEEVLEKTADEATLLSALNLPVDFHLQLSRTA